MPSLSVSALSDSPQIFNKSGYRADIDGLRALAVISVVLFHADLGWVPGGFIGVDIFFVISGFLITRLLIQDFFRETFSIRAFYIRRVRRIFPALAAVVLFSFATGFFILPANEFAALGDAAKGLAWFTSNHVFWNIKNNYWSQNLLSTQPLLHTWSLAVEEQFYLLFPCLLAISFYFNRRSLAQRGVAPSDKQPRSIISSLKFLLWTITITSFVLSVWMIRKDAAATFYLLPFRAWELLTGSLLAVHLMARPTDKIRRAYVEMAGMAGIALLLFAVFFYDKATSFPGLHALAPCIGAALLIYAGNNSVVPIVSRILSTRPLVMIGLISYSLYLWHWPILVFVRSFGWYAWGLPSISLPAVLTVTVLVSWVSWRWIEQPFRHRRSQLPSRGTELIVAIIMLCICYGLGALAHRVGKTATPFQQLQPKMLAQLGRDVDITPGIRCEGNPDLALIEKHGGGCQLGIASSDRNPPVFAIVGDSHARMWTSALDRLATKANIPGLALTYSSCVPALGIVPPSRKECVSIIEAALNYLAKSPIKTVILAGYWVDAAETDQAREGASSTDFYDGLDRTLSLLTQAGKTIYLMKDVPELQNNETPREKAIESIRGGGKAIYSQSLQQHRKRQFPVDQQIIRLQKKYHFMVIDPANQICGSAGCLVAINGRTLYRDKHHLTDDATVIFRGVFPQQLLKENAS